MYLANLNNVKGVHKINYRHYNNEMDTFLKNREIHVDRIKLKIISNY